MRYEMAPLAIESDRSERAAFIRRTYAHLAFAVLAFVGLEAVIFGLLRPLTDGGFDRAMFSMFQSRFSWLIVMVAFIGVSYLARYWAFNGGSVALQYAGLGLYIVAEVLIFVPILYVAMFLIPVAPGHSPFELVGQAGVLTLCLFAGLTAVVFITGKDFSFIGPILSIAFFFALKAMLG